MQYRKLGTKRSLILSQDCSEERRDVVVFLSAELGKVLELGTRSLREIPREALIPAKVRTIGINLSPKWTVAEVDHPPQLGAVVTTPVQDHAAVAHVVPGVALYLHAGR